MTVPNSRDSAYSAQTPLIRAASGDLAARPCGPAPSRAATVSAMATIGDVAKQAGVSPSTVSYVLSGKRTISEETRQRVLAAIEVLGYHPHAGARALASN